MSLTETPHFSISKNMMQKSKPILDIGCAYGFTSKSLLQNGFQVIANDLSQQHLDEGFADLDDELRKRLTLKPGSILDLRFEANSLDGIVALNVMHFFRGPQLRELFGNFYKWLAPNGVLTTSSVSPYMLFSPYMIMDDQLRRKELKKWKSRVARQWLDSTLERDGCQSVSAQNTRLL